MEAFVTIITLGLLIALYFTLEVLGCFITTICKAAIEIARIMKGAD